MSDANFYSDNADLNFHMNNMVNWEAVFRTRSDMEDERDRWGSAEEAKEAYLGMLEDPVGELAANRMAPRAVEIDELGCRLRENRVELPPGMVKNLQDLADADLMGFTLPVRYGGLGFPYTVYTAAVEIISRADASLMNLFGLQGIADTIALFADEEVRRQYLPRFASGDITGAMVLTEPDAGSDLLSIQTAAVPDEVTSRWRLRGTKRFITNGCGDVLLVLARSEDPQTYRGGRGLSLFLVEKGARVQIRRVEHKLGIHGAPTCELFLDDAEGVLIGRRGYGLTRYVAWLMDAARLSVAAQALGIAEAAVREATAYAGQREQFGEPIRRFPAVADMLVNMQVDLEAVRSLLYAASEQMDLDFALGRQMESLPSDDPRKGDLVQERKRQAGALDILTPMVKFYAAETAQRITSDVVQVLGGNGYIVDYPAERYYRDARITSIYEGTSQIQASTAVSRLLKGSLDSLLTQLAQRERPSGLLNELAQEVDAAREDMEHSLEFVRDKMRGREKDPAYRDLMARRLVEMAADVLIGYLFLGQAEHWDRKAAVAEKFIRDMRIRAKAHRAHVCAGRKLTLDHFNSIVGE
ncbi:MAG: acyl-CoA dehydrogenase family protein [Deltaproteobacteria bacterium]|nr:acyl-CoA dehydrogenase family protein [Deltaproteobacteria bacterium]MBW2308651.1 acyl-CoA dehydrogenase family protein [Deltaproteobacteria bacterium]